MAVNVAVALGGRICVAVGGGVDVGGDVGAAVSVCATYVEIESREGSLAMRVHAINCEMRRSVYRMDTGMICRLDFFIAIDHPAFTAVRFQSQAYIIRELLGGGFKKVISKRHIRNLRYAFYWFGFHPHKIVSLIR